MLAALERPRWATVAAVVANGLTAVAITVVAAVVFVTPHTARERAIVAMGVGLVAIWCGLGGLAQSLRHRAVVSAIRRMAVPIPLRFVLACIAFALAEEAVSTLMTNTAPLLGVSPREAYITPSTNWLHTVTLHSVVVFIPMFAVWAWWLGRRRFHPAEVYVIVGLNGLLAEWFTFGQLNPIWIPIYGLMAWLPARACADDLGRARPRPTASTFVAVLITPLVAGALLALVVHPLHPAWLVDLGTGG